MKLKKIISIILASAFLTAAIPALGASSDYTQDFESGKWEAGWTTTAKKGTMAFDTGEAHSGDTYVKVGSDELQRYSNVVSGQNITVWLYDDVSAGASVGVLRAIKGSNGITMGVYTAINKSNYVYRVGGTSDKWVATEVPRTTGWHRLTIDATSKKNADLYIDGIFVGSTSDYISYDCYEIGSPWPATANGARFDDFSLTYKAEGATGDDVEEITSYRDVSGEDADVLKILNSLGIKMVEGNEFKPTQRVTREEFVSYAVKMMGFNDQVPAKTKFNDVDEANEYSGYINVASDMGLISGTGGSNFDPKSEITYNQAIKILVLLAGYKEYAAYNGGYSEGHTLAAINSGILDDISWRGDMAITRVNAAHMLYNTLHAWYMDNVFEKEEMVMKKYLGVEKVEGIVYAVEDTGISSDKYTSKGMCWIGDEEYHIGTATDVSDYIGHKVTVYIRENSEVKEPELCVVIEKGTQIFTIDADDINSATLSSITYQTDKKEKKIDIPQGIYVMYNGRAAFDYTAEDMQPESGYIELIDNNNDSDYDVMSITSYRNLYVGSIRKNDMLVYDKYDKTNMLDVDECEELKVYKNGAETLFAAITAGSLISYAKSKDDERVRIYISGDSVKGTINALYLDDSEIEIDGEIYTLAEGTYIQNLTLGYSGTFLLDIDGKIGAVADINDDKYKYAYSIKTYIDDFENTSVKLFTGDGAIEKYEFADKFRLNGEKCDPVKVISSATFPTLQLVKYRINAADEIVELFTADTDYQGKDTYKEDNGAFWLYEKKKIKYYAGIGFRGSGGTILPNATTKVFYIPDEDPTSSEKEIDYDIGVATGFKDNVLYNYEAYNVNVVNVPEVMIMYVNDADEATSNTKTMPLQIFVSMISGVDDNGEEIDYVKYYFEGQLLSEPVKKGLTLFDEKPEKFSTINIYNNSRGQIVGTFNEASVRTDLNGATLSNDGRMIWRVKVDNISGDYMVVRDDNGKTYVLNLPTDRVYTIRDSYVTVGTRSDICIDDDILLRLYDGNVKEAIIYAED